MFDTLWRKRALAAEKALQEATDMLTFAGQKMAQIEATINERATLASITRTGRINRFTFTRNGEVYTIETMGTWDDDIDNWKRSLLGPVATNEGTIK